MLGRDADIAALERFLDRVAATGGALVIDGEAGIGKTTIWREALERATRRAFRVLVARPAEAEADLSYAALTDLLAAAYEQVGDELPLPQRRALDVALLGAESDGQADARTTADGVPRSPESARRRESRVVALDDVQWLDRASERALEFAVRRLPPRVNVLAARRCHGESDVPLDLRQAFADESIERVALGPLSAAALYHLIRGELGTAPPRPCSSGSTSASGGNPFYALEIARALARQAETATTGDPLPIPDNLQELVLARMRELSPAGRDAALVAAALLASHRHDGCRRARCARGRRGRDRRARGGRDHRRRARPDPVRPSAVRLGRLRGGLTRATAPAPPAALRVVSDPEERARHLAESAQQADSAIAAEIERAADRASRRGAQDAAARLYGAAARLTPDDRPDDEAKRMLGEAAALFAAGDPSGARTVAEAALARAAADIRRAEANLLLGEIAWVERPGQLQVGYLERALSLAGRDRRLRGRIHAQFGEALLLDQRKGLEHAEAAAALLDEDEDPGLLAQVLTFKFSTGRRSVVRRRGRSWSAPCAWKSAPARTSSGVGCR